MTSTCRRRAQFEAENSFAGQRGAGGRKAILEQSILYKVSWVNLVVLNCTG